MGAKKTKSQKSGPLTDTDPVFVQKANQSHGEVQRLKRQGAVDQKIAQKLLDNLERDISSASGTPSPGTDIACSQCYPNYQNCISTGGDPNFCYNNYLICIATCT